MNYRDDFFKSFDEKEDFLQFLDHIEERASWKTYPSSSIQIAAVSEVPDASSRISVEAEANEIIHDTQENTGLLLEIDGNIYPLGSTALKSLGSRARISGYALQDLGKEKLARIFTDCLQVAKGNALIRIHEGKVRAVHGGDEEDYSILPMPQVFEAASIYLMESYDDTKFTEAYFDHWMATATWEVQDKRLLDTYRELLYQYGQIADDTLSASIRINTSDVGVSGANIFYSMLLGRERRPLLLGDALRLEHSGHASLEDFTRNMGQIFARYKEAVEGLSKLFQIYVDYPANVMAGIMKKAGIGTALRAQTVEQFKAGHGPGKCNGYEVYCGICESIFLAQSDGMNSRSLTDLEEKVSRCLTYRFHEYDIPGTVSY
ncbi:MAG: endonuclease III [Monoglobales bacterium]